MFKNAGATLRVSAGDTGQVLVVPEGYTFDVSDRAILTVKSSRGNVNIEKVTAPDVEGNFVFNFTNMDTEDMDAHTDYSWDIRIAFGARLDDDGRVIDGEQVVSLFEPAPFMIEEVVGDV